MAHHHDNQEDEDARDPKYLFQRANEVTNLLSELRMLAFRASDTAMYRNVENLSERIRRQMYNFAHQIEHISSLLISLTPVVSEDEWKKAFPDFKDNWVRRFAVVLPDELTADEADIIQENVNQYVKRQVQKILRERDGTI